MMIYYHPCPLRADQTRAHNTGSSPAQHYGTASNYRSTAPPVKQKKWNERVVSDIRERYRFFTASLKRAVWLGITNSVRGRNDNNPKTTPDIDYSVGSGWTARFSEAVIRTSVEIFRHDESSITGLRSANHACPKGGHPVIRHYMVLIPETW